LAGALRFAPPPAAAFRLRDLLAFLAACTRFAVAAAALLFRVRAAFLAAALLFAFDIAMFLRKFLACYIVQVTCFCTVCVILYSRFCKL
jgi:hypothetical protein